MNKLVFRGTITVVDASLAEKAVESGTEAPPSEE